MVESLIWSCVHTTSSPLGNRVFFPPRKWKLRVCIQEHHMHEEDGVWSQGIKRKSAYRVLGL